MTDMLPQVSWKLRAPKMSVLSLDPFPNHTIWPAGALGIALVMKKLSRHLEKLKAILIMVSFLPFRWQVLLRSGTVMIPFRKLQKSMKTVGMYFVQVLNESDGI